MQSHASHGEDRNDDEGWRTALSADKVVWAKLLYQCSVVWIRMIAMEKTTRAIEGGEQCSQRSPWLGLGYLSSAQGDKIVP